jgi:hypothetical protein
MVVASADAAVGAAIAKATVPVAASVEIKCFLLMVYEPGRIA